MKQVSSVETKRISSLTFEEELGRTNVIITTDDEKEYHFAKYSFDNRVFFAARKEPVGVGERPHLNYFVYKNWELPEKVKEEALEHGEEIVKCKDKPERSIEIEGNTAKIEVVQKDKKSLFGRER